MIISLLNSALSNDVYNYSLKEVSLAISNCISTVLDASVLCNSFFLIG